MSINQNPCNDRSRTAQPQWLILALIFALMTLGAPAVWGQETEVSGSGELGLLVNRGNSDSESVNASLKVLFEKDHWSNESTASGVYSRDSGDTSANRFVLANRTDYRFGNHRYAVGAFRYDRDRFSTFRYQGSAALGYGYRLVDTETHRLRVEAGPGFRVSEIRAISKQDDEVIARGFFDYRWDISESTRFENKLLIEAGSDNTFSENATSLSVAINSRVQLKTAVTLRYNSDVDPGKKKNDLLSTINLVYNFKPTH
jgi:putative salt-induced outer membrane protein